MALGIRSALKSGLKKVLGMQSPSDTTPPNWQSRPPASTVPLKPPPDSDPVAAAPEPAPMKESPAAALAAAMAADAAKAAEGVTLSADPTPAAPAADGPEITLESVQEILDDMVRPALQGDGGDITLIKIEDNSIYVRLVGACASCPSSIMTMKMGVEALLREEFPTLVDVIQVDEMSPIG